MSLRLVRDDEPCEAHENVALRQMLERLTLGTDDREGFVLRPSESEALYDVLVHRVFSPSQLDQVEKVIQVIDPHQPDSDWDDDRLAAFVGVMRMHIDRHEWINFSIFRLHAAMRSQEPKIRFRLWFTRAVLVAFLTVDFLSYDPKDLLRLTG